MRGRGQTGVDDADNKRKTRRSRVLREGKLVFNAGTSLINCIIRDQSEGGARLSVPAPTALPKQCELLCLTEGIFYPAEIVWRRGNYVGIVFVGQPRRGPRRKKISARPVQTLD